jgi:hypothetical protein
MPLWIRADVDLTRDPRLYSRKPWERWLWLCLNLTVKEHFVDTATIRGYDAGQLSKLYNLEVPPSSVRKALEYFQAQGMVKLVAGGGVLLANFGKEQRDPTNALRQSKYREAHREAPSVTKPAVTAPLRKALPEGQGQGQVQEDLHKKGGGDLEASQTSPQSPAPSLAKAGKPGAPSGTLEQLEASWPRSLLGELRAAVTAKSKSANATWLAFLRASAPFDEASRVEAARKFLERGTAAKGRAGDYLVAMIQGIAEERGGSSVSPRPSSSRPSVPSADETAAYRRQLAAEEAEAKNLTTEQRQAAIARGRALAAADRGRPALAVVANGVHKATHPGRP